MLANRRVAPDHYHLTLHAPAAAQGARAGQFVNLLLPGWPGRFDPLLPRPMSYYWLDAAAGRLGVLFQVVGRGTALLSGLAPDDRLFVVGPLGRPFPTATRPPWLLVGGGVGVAPLVALAQEARRAGVAVEVFLGARTAERLLGLEEFRALGLEPRVATDDGTLGRRGVVTELLADRLGPGASGAGVAAGGGTIYGCGPVPMLRALKRVAEASGLEAYLSLEAIMGCGVGACMGCVWPLTSGGGPSYARLCVDGPILECRQVVLE